MHVSPAAGAEGVGRIGVDIEGGGGALVAFAFFLRLWSLSLRDISWVAYSSTGHGICMQAQWCYCISLPCEESVT